MMKSVTVYLSDGEDLRDFIRKELESLLTKRYKMTHMAEDMRLNYSMLYRFMKGGSVSEEFYIKAIKYLTL